MRRQATRGNKKLSNSRIIVIIHRTGRSVPDRWRVFNVPSIKTYDFIVVGAGSAGCVVAGRLSEHFNVLLLEAGGNPVPASDVPAFVLQVAYDRLTNYEFPGLPQTRGARATGGLQFFSFGKMMGGSGSHNDMVHNRGSPYDYDNWANLTGDPSWSYSSVIKYFKKYEDEELERYKQTAEGVLGVLGEGPQAFFVSERAKQDGETQWADISVTLDATPNELRPREHLDQNHSP